MILYAARRWLHLSPDEWDALSWDVRETYLDGLSEEEDIPFRMERGAGPGPGGRPRTREVPAAVAVIDLDAMRQELEANPAARRRT